MTECTCWMEYPNENKRHNNGSWKCVDKYKNVRQLETIPIPNMPYPKYVRKTKCIYETEEESTMTQEEKELKEARDACVKLGLLQKQGTNLSGTDTYVKTEKGERIFKELLEDAKNGVFYN